MIVGFQMLRGLRAFFGREHEQRAASACHGHPAFAAVVVVVVVGRARLRSASSHGGVTPV